MNCNHQYSIQNLKVEIQTMCFGISDAKICLNITLFWKTISTLMVMLIGIFFKQLEIKITVAVSLVNRQASKYKIWKTKPNSLYRYNLRPWIYKKKIGKWVTLQELPIFKQSNVVNPSTGLKYYELTFNLKIDDDKIWVAMLPPYTYSKLKAFIKPYLQHKHVHVQYIHSMASNSIPIIFYNPWDVEDAQIQENFIIIARHHPGETWSSYLMEQIIKFLFANYANDKFLGGKPNKIKRYILIPMLNPDGVIYGNFRCDLSGTDLNRIWMDNDLKFKHPTMFKLKKIFGKLHINQRANNVFIDLHSHSKSYGIFGYMSHIQTDDNYFHCCKLLAQNFSSKSGGVFNSNSTLYVDRTALLKGNKKDTARAYFSKYCQISMTLEISFDGFLDGKHVCKFMPKHFQSMAKSLLQQLNISQLLNVTQMPKGIVKSQKQENKTIGHAEKQLQSGSDSDAQAYYSVSKKFIKEKQKKSLLKQLLKKSSVKQSELQQRKTNEYKKSKVNRTELSEKVLKIDKLKQQLKTKKNSTNQNKSVPKIRYIADKVPNKQIKNPTVFQIPSIIEICGQVNSKSMQSRGYNLEKFQIHRQRNKSIKNKIYYALNNYQLLKNSNRVSKPQEGDGHHINSIQGAKIKSYLEMQKQLIYQCNDYKLRPIIKKDKYAHLQKSKIITQIREKMSYNKKSMVFPKQ